MEVSSHLSGVEEDEAKRIEESFKMVILIKQKTKRNKTKKETKEEPVIIRRQVILEEDKTKQEKKPENNRKDLGFVERGRNKDYNIVYRNKPTKPLTVSELFGKKKNKK